MSVPVFKELDKSATDLITKGFPTDSHGFEIEGGSIDGVKFKATGTHTGVVLNSLFETTKVFATRGLTLKVSAKAEKNVPVYTLEAAYEPVGVPGLKATVNSECKLPETGEVNTNKLTVLYKRGDFTMEDSIAYTKGKLSFAGSMALAYQAVRAGAHALANLSLEGDNRLTLGGYGFKLGYAPHKFLTIITNYDQGEKGTTAGATLYYAKDFTEAAGQVIIDPSRPAATPGFIVALNHAYDLTTTLKAKVATAVPSVSVALKHQLSPALSVTIASECAYPVPNEKLASHKHGLSVNLKL